LDLLRDGGLLLVQDRSLPNVVSLVTGETLSSSWWAHPQGKVIFRHLAEIADHPDVLSTKLIGGKVTFVHRRLWPALLAVARAREPWQLARLPPDARELLVKLERRGSLTASGPAAKALERRLLVHGEQVHTEAGKHQTRLETWQEWSQRAGCETELSPAEGRQQLEEAVRQLGGSGEELPWRKVRKGP
jgi:hypothetical protein